MKVGSTPFSVIDSNDQAWVGQSGYNLVQVLVALTLLGVLGGFAISKWNQFGRKQTLIGEGKALLVFLEEARSYGLKKNKQVGIQFTALGATYQLFEDKNANGKMDLGESVKTLNLHRNVSFGLPTNPPATGPQGQTLAVTGLSGAWTDGWIAPLDLSQSPSVGLACLKQNQQTSLTVCVYGQTTTHKAEAALWDGNVWINL